MNGHFPALDKSPAEPCPIIMVDGIPFYNGKPDNLDDTLSTDLFLYYLDKVMIESWFSTGISGNAVYAGLYAPRTQVDVLKEKGMWNNLILASEYSQIKANKSNLSVRTRNYVELLVEDAMERMYNKYKEQDYGRTSQ